MRALEINKRTVYYANPIAEEENALGEVTPRYSLPRPVRIRVQYLKTTQAVAQYGQDPRCSAKLIASEDFGFTPGTVFWIDAGTTEPYDYAMSGKPIRTINGVVYPLREAVIGYAD